MNTQRYYIIGILLALTLGLIALRPEPQGTPILAHASISSVATTTNIATASAEKSIQANPVPAIPATPTTTPKAAAPERAVAAFASNVTIVVGSSSYPVYVAPGGTALDAMQVAASSSSFTFTGREYPSLGFFVESIDGAPNANGFYWFLYVNGVSSQTGASQTTLHDGYTVEWRYEKNQ